MANYTRIVIYNSPSSIYCSSIFSIIIKVSTKEASLLLDAQRFQRQQFFELMPCTKDSKGKLTNLGIGRWLTLLNRADYYLFKSILFYLYKAPVLLLSLRLGKTSSFLTYECCVTNIEVGSSSTSLITVSVIVTSSESLQSLLDPFVSISCLRKLLTSTTTTF